jgi:hypothetical protein
LGLHVLNLITQSAVLTFQDIEASAQPLNLAFDPFHFSVELEPALFAGCNLVCQGTRLLWKALVVKFLMLEALEFFRRAEELF